MDQSEDCLLLDVITPENVTGNLPVLVNIHGGGKSTR
jgi:carboxylesterase type B